MPSTLTLCQITEHIQATIERTTRGVNIDLKWSGRYIIRVIYKASKRGTIPRSCITWMPEMNASPEYSLEFARALRWAAEQAFNIDSQTAAPISHVA